MNNLLKQDLQRSNGQLPKNTYQEDKLFSWKLIVIPITSFLVGILVAIIISQMASFFFLLGYYLNISREIYTSVIAGSVFILLGFCVKKLIHKIGPKWYVFLTIPIVLPAIWFSYFMLSFGVSWESFAENIFNNFIISIPFISFFTGIIFVYFKKNRKIIIIWLILLIIILGGNYFIYEIRKEESKKRMQVITKVINERIINGPHRNDQRISDIIKLMKALSIYYKDNGYYPATISSLQESDLLYQSLYAKNFNDDEFNNSPLIDPFDSECLYEYSSDSQNYRLNFCYESDSLDLIRSRMINSILGNEIISYDNDSTDYIEGNNYVIDLSYGYVEGINSLTIKISGFHEIKYE